MVSPNTDRTIMPETQNTSHLLMIRPVNFSFNTETAVNNSFQENTQDLDVQEKAAREFDALAAELRSYDIDVTIVQDTPEPYTPDSVFPNNWISFHADGHLYLYPMFAANRRLERKVQVLGAIREKFEVTEIIDLSGFEHMHAFLEGTGSMVLDRENRIAYACLSPRTHQKVLEAFCQKEQYQAVSFNATDTDGLPIYHTNVMMCVAGKYAVVCLDCIRDETERSAVITAIRDSGKQLIPISMDQMDHFAGNMLQVCNREGKPFLVMSSQAYQSLSQEQLDAFAQYNPIIHADISTIERNGGGSARCMIAEVFLPLKK